MAQAAPAEPVRLYSGDDRRLPNTVASRLKESREQLVAQIVAGHFDPPTYKHVSGKIAGIDLALEICDEASKELFGE